MSNRILKESICMSREIDALTDFQECLFYRLIVKADDFGICPADPVILAHLLYPRREHTDKEQIREALGHFASLGLIRLYTAGDDTYLQLVSWSKHQRIRSCVRRNPAPEDGEPVPPAEAGKSKRKKKAEPKEKAGPAEPEEQEEPDGQAGREQDHAVIRELPVAELPLNDNTLYGVTRAEADEWARLYPAVNVEAELRKMAGWCAANPQRRKTRSGIRRFVNGWLAREQDRGQGVSLRPLPENPFIRMALEGKEDE